MNLRLTVFLGSCRYVCVWKWIWGTFFPQVRWSHRQKVDYRPGKDSSPVHVCVSFLGHCVFSTLLGLLGEVLYWAEEVGFLAGLVWLANERSFPTDLAGTAEGHENDQEMGPEYVWRTWGGFLPTKKGGLGLPCLIDKVDMPSLKVNRSRQKLPETMLVSEICMFLPKFLIPRFNILCICFPFSLQSSVFGKSCKRKSLT